MSDQSKPETSGSPQTPTPPVTQPDKETLKKLTAGYKPGDVIVDRYEVQKMLGRGGMGMVYLVWDRELKQPMALKTLLPQYLSSSHAVKRFVREVNAVRQLDHPCIVRIFDAQQIGSILYYTMEYVDGTSLYKWMKKKGKLGLGSVVRVLSLLCHALEHAHQYAIHRDLSPDNVMVLSNGNIKLLDFGLAKLTNVESAFTMIGVSLGKQQYMAPEQRMSAAEVDKRADICNDSTGIQLGGTGLIGLLVVTLNAAASSHDIYEHMVSTGSHTIPFGWGGVPVGVEYTGISATWVCSAHTPSNYDCHFKSLGVYEQSQYNIPLESDASCDSADLDVCFTNNACDYWHGTLKSLFASQANRNGSGTSISHGTVKVEAWCSDHGHPVPNDCSEHYIFREFQAPRAPSCVGGSLGTNTVARSPYNTDLACGDRVCIVGIGEKTVTDQGGEVGLHQLDNFTTSVACTGIGHLVQDGAITIRASNKSLVYD